MKRQTDKPLAGPSRHLSASSIESTVLSEAAILRTQKREQEREKAYLENFKNELQICEPFKGTIGKPVNLIVNCFELQVQRTWINLYEVWIKIQGKKGVQIPKKKLLKRELFWDFLMKNTGPDKFNVHRTQLCFDDERALWTTKPLPHIDKSKAWRANEILTFQHRYEGIRGKLDVIIEMAYKERFEIGGNLLTTPMAQYLMQNLVTQARRIPETWEGGNIYHCMGKFAIRVGINQTYSPLEVDIISRLYEGLCINVKTGIRGQPILNVALAHKLLIQMELPLIQFYALCEEERIYRDSELDRLARRGISFSRNQIDKFNDYFHQVEIKTNYDPIRHYTFSRLSDKDAKNTYFEDSNGVLGSVEEYYLNRYNIPLRFPNLPLIEVTKPNILLPIELCVVSLRPQRVHRKIPPAFSQTICRRATMDPGAYFNRINNMSKHIILERNATILMREFGVRVPSRRDELEPMSIEGHVLPAPACQYEDPQRSRTLKPDLSAYQSYLIVCTANMRRFSDSGKFVSELVNAASDLDQGFVNGRDAYCSDEQFRSYEELKAYVERKKKKHGDVQRILFVFILGENSDDLYSWIKRCGDIELGVSTQCIDGSALIEKMRGQGNKLRPMCKNLVLKTITRLEGIINVIDTDHHRNNPCNEAFTKYTSENDPTLFIGVFSTKAAAGDNRDTVLTMSFNSNAAASTFQGLYCLAETGTDFLDETGQLFYEALSKFEKNLHRMPSRVLIFRSGITDNLNQFVSEFEVENFQKSWERYLQRHPKISQFSPQILYINVERNHKVRFKQTTPTSHGRPDYNVPKGTVIDNTPINSPHGNGFYLCSHKGLLGTSRSAYYEIKYNSWNVNPKRFPDELQPIIYSLCYLVQRSIATVSIPAPAYYSRLLFDRVLQYLKTQSNGLSLAPHRDIASTTYFT